MQQLPTLDIIIYESGRKKHRLQCKPQPYIKFMGILSWTRHKIKYEPKA